MSRGRRAVLLAAGALFVGQLVSYQVASLQSRSALAVLSPVGNAAGFVCLERPGVGFAPVGISGSYAIDPLGGSVVVSPRDGAVIVRLVVVRPGRTDRVAEALVSAGETLSMRSGVFGVRTERTTGSATPCKGHLSVAGPSLKGRRTSGPGRAESGRSS